VVHVQHDLQNNGNKINKSNEHELKNSGHSTYLVHSLARTQDYQIETSLQAPHPNQVDWEGTTQQHSAALAVLPW